MTHSWTSSSGSTELIVMHCRYEVVKIVSTSRLEKRSRSYRAIWWIGETLKKSPTFESLVVEGGPSEGALGWFGNPFGKLPDEGLCWQFLQAIQCQLCDVDILFSMASCQLLDIVVDYGGDLHHRGRKEWGGEGDGEVGSVLELG